MTILEALDNQTLLGVPFTGDSWKPWRSFLAAVFGLPMPDPDALATFRECTGRTEPPTQRAEEVFVVAGRRSGKSHVAALLAVYLATFVDHSKVLRWGARGTLPIIACDQLSKIA